MASGGQVGSGSRKEGGLAAHTRWPRRKELARAAALPHSRGSALRKRTASTEGTKRNAGCLRQAQSGSILAVGLLRGYRRSGPPVLRDLGLARNRASPSLHQITVLRSLPTPEGGPSALHCGKFGHSAHATRSSVRRVAHSGLKVHVCTNPTLDGDCEASTPVRTCTECGPRRFRSAGSVCARVEPQRHTWHHLPARGWRSGPGGANSMARPASLRQNS